MINLVDFNNLAAKRLEDEEKVYWTTDEIDSIIKEALYTFAAISGYWKNQISLKVTNNQQVYDLLKSDDISLGFDNIKSSLTYQYIVDRIDKDLLGYDSLVSNNELISLITNSINSFQSETKLVLAQDRFNINIGEGVVVGEEILDIVRAYYIDSSGRYNALQLADENRVALFDRNYTITNAKPRFYSIANLSLLKVDLFPKPIENGFLELIYIKGKSGTQTLASDCLIPNNLVPYLKYKIEADIFAKDGIAKDPFRLEYCEKRWKEGLLIGNNYSAINNIKLDGLNKTLSSFADFDGLRYDWRNDSELGAKKINALALAGYNILGFNRKPISDHSVLLEAIVSAPVNLDDIELRSDYVPYILDYCLHLASFKDGIASIQKSLSALEGFIKVAVSHNQYLQQRNIDYLSLLGKSKYPLKQARIAEEENAA